MSCNNKNSTKRENEYIKMFKAKLIYGQLFNSTQISTFCIINIYQN